MTEDRYLVIDVGDIEEYTSLLDRLARRWEEKEIYIPDNSTEELLREKAEPPHTLKKYSRDGEVFYRFESREGFVLYGPEETLEKVAGDESDWVELRASLQ